MSFFDSLEELQERWSGSAGGFSHVEVWDEAAAGYAEKPLPTFEDDPFLAMMQAEGALTPDARVLDIGCGAGLYSIALAPHVAEVVGCDFSEKMIEAARNRATAEGCTNAQFICGNFADLTFNEPFDVVFAHFTPAINSATEFQKMVSLARSWCFMACPTRRRDFVLEEARRLASVEHGDPDCDRNFLYGFAYAWLLGKTPTVMHYDDVWLDQRTLEDAQTVYANHLVAPDLSPEQKAIVQDYLAQIAEEGTVYERIETTIAMLGFRV